uniref:Porphobilinogen deaminaseic n=1 Tax=Rhizophora mucronata TaxID=61149 RepID=A0A2P2JY63_RHIMU
MIMKNSPKKLNVNPEVFSSCSLSFCGVLHELKNPGPALESNSLPASFPIRTISSRVYGPFLEVSSTRVPSGEATSPLNVQLPSSSLQAYPAIGVRQDPSSVSRNALSQATANLVSS